MALRSIKTFALLICGAGLGAIALQPGCKLADR
jgi:hypothetical protein